MQTKEGGVITTRYSTCTLKEPCVARTEGCKVRSTVQLAVGVKQSHFGARRRCLNFEITLRMSKEPQKRFLSFQTVRSFTPNILNHFGCHD